MTLFYGNDYCVDAGTNQCPCHLAETGECPSCSILRGEEVCRCGWAGECVYQRYLLRPLSPGRDNRLQLVRVSGYENINERAYLLRLTISDELSHELRRPGSYVFIKPVSAPEFFFTPISVMEVENGAIWLAVEMVGPKTRVLRYPGREVLVKGPYRNGLMGLRAAESLTYGQALLLAKGIAQAPALHLGQYLLRRGNDVTALLWPGTVGAVFIANRLRELGAAVRLLEKSPDHGAREMAAEIAAGSYDLVASFGPDRQHQTVADILSRLDRRAAYVTTNNAVLTCGEGICGSCLVPAASGRKVRTCKHQLDARELWGAGERLGLSEIGLQLRD